MRRWFARRFLTQLRTDPFGNVWVERPDWWTFGGRSGVMVSSSRSIREAREYLDEWQEDQFKRRRTA